MRDFTFYNPTRVEFGQGKENKIGAYMAEYGVKRLCLFMARNVLKGWPL